MSHPRNTTLAKTRTEQAVTKLDLTFPLWVFDPDDRAIPLKLADLTADSRRARVFGWYLAHSEYQMDLSRNQDFDWHSRNGHNFSSLPTAAEVANFFRYNLDARSEDYTAVVEEHQLADDTSAGEQSTSTNHRSVNVRTNDRRARGGGGNARNNQGQQESSQPKKRVERAMPLVHFLEETADKSQPRTKKLMSSLLRIQRTYDEIHLWDRNKTFSMHPIHDSPDIIGRASQVYTIQELVQARHVNPDILKHDIVKVQFEFADSQGGNGYGVMWTGRHYHPERGIVLGALKSYNISFLAGTEFEHLLEKISRDGAEYENGADLWHDDTMTQWKYQGI